MNRLRAITKLILGQSLAVLSLVSLAAAWTPVGDLSKPIPVLNLDCEYRLGHHSYSSFTGDNVQWFYTSVGRTLKAGNVTTQYLTFNINRPDEQILNLTGTVLSRPDQTKLDGLYTSTRPPFSLYISLSRTDNIAPSLYLAFPNNQAINGDFAPLINDKQWALESNCLTR